MKKVIIAAATFAVVLVVGLAPNKAQSLQYGGNIGYSSIGFTLHGGSVEFLLGFGGKDGHRPQGSVLHVGFAGMSGTGETDLTQATFDGVSYGVFSISPAARALEGLTLYGITNPNKARGDGTAYIISAGYEWVFSRVAPGLGVIGGLELYISQGGFEGTAAAVAAGLPSSLKTEGGIGGGVVVGASYYMRNGINFAFKTGLGGVDPGEINFASPAGNIKIEPETVFYASPTFSVGYIY